MSDNIWTPTALASNARIWEGSGWRAVEAQHKVATMSLVGGNLAEQAELEDILETGKPRLPPEVAGLHWLLATPFRYWPLPGGSRFRERADPGVFYGAEGRQTACAESGYWRLQFRLESETLRARAGEMPMSLIRFAARTDKALDLSTEPLVQDRVLWTQPQDYTATHRLARAAREAGLEAIRYESVRDPGGLCLALLTPAPFRAVSAPIDTTATQSWTLHIAPPNRVTWMRPLEDERFQFAF